MALDVTLDGAQTSTLLTDITFRAPKFYDIRIVSRMMVRQCTRRSSERYPKNSSNGLRSAAAGCTYCESDRVVSFILMVELSVCNVLARAGDHIASQYEGNTGK